MTRLYRSLVSLGVASAVLLLTILVAHAQNGGAPVVITKIRKAEAKAKGMEPVAKEAQTVVIAPRMLGRAVAIPLNQRYAQMLRPTLRGEYHVIVTIGNLSKDQRKQLARDGELTLRETAIRFAEFRQNLRPLVNQGNDPGNTFPDARKMIQAGIVKSAKAHLSSADVAGYLREVEARNTQLRNVLIENIVAKLDEIVFFSPSQREKLIESLGTNWKEAWNPIGERFITTPQFVPRLLDPYVTPVLSQTQTKVWNATEKQEMNIVPAFWSIGPRIDDAAFDQELEDARKEADSRDASPEVVRPDTPVVTPRKAAVKQDGKKE
jgi:hypothetical protein